MPYLQGITDLAMTFDGDLIIEKGDLKTHSGVNWLMIEIRKILKTSNPEWKLHPNVGAGLDDFIGEPNTRDTAKIIEKRIMDKILEQQIQYPMGISVKVVPLNVSEIVIYVYIEEAESNLMLSKLVYDYAKGSVNEYQKVEESVQIVSATTAPRNPYFARVR